MRIISGLNGGQTIKVPKNFKLRPTTDQSKEGIFNIISNYYDVDKLEVLDLFSGTGNISYEFASRGAKYVRAVEINFKHYNFIRSENRRMNLNIDVIKSDVFKYLNINNDQFDIIFADPPYNFDINKYEIIIDKIFKSKIINYHGLLIIEHSNKIELNNFNNYYQTRKYGGCFLVFLKTQITDNQNFLYRFVNN